MQYFDPHGGFCESRYWSNATAVREPVSAASALWIAFIGVYGLLANDGRALHLDDVVVFCCIAVNGLGSALFHATGDTEVVKRSGRWSSAAFHGYLWDSAEQRPQLR